MDSAKMNNVFLYYHMAMESATKVGGGNNYKIENIGKAKLQRKGCLSISAKYSDEAFHIANTHLVGSNDHVDGAIPYGIDMLSELMDCAFNMFLIDEDATFTAENKLEQLKITE